MALLCFNIYCCNRTRNIKFIIGKNLALFQPDKKGIIISALFAITILLAGVYTILGEKVINPEGHTLSPEEEYYAYKYSSRTYLYFLLGFFIIPIGTIIFLLFIVEYKKNIEKNKDNSEPKEKKEDIINESNISEQNIIADDSIEKQNEEDNKNKKRRRIYS